MIIGHVQLHNQGNQPFGLKSAGFKLFGKKGPIQGSLKCPRNTIAAGSMLQVSHGHTTVTLCLNSCQQLFK